MYRNILFCVAVLLFIPSLAFSDGQTPSTIVRYAFDPNVTEMDSVDFSITVTDDPGYAASVYWAHSFYLGDASAPTQTAYTGLQSNAGDKRTFLFSVWDATEAKEGSPGSYCVTFTGEGTGKSCRKHYEWKVGHTYRFHVAYEKNYWISVTVTDLNDGTDFKLGSIKTAHKHIAPTNMSSWVEYFEWSRQRTRCLGQPYSKAEMGIPVGMSNGQELVPHISSQNMSKYCPEFSSITLNDKNSIQENGIGNSIRAMIKNTSGYCVSALGAPNKKAVPAIANLCTGIQPESFVYAKDNTLQLRDSFCLTGWDNVGVTTCVPGERRQQWTIDNGEVRSISSDLCLTDQGKYLQLAMKKCKHSSAQKWEFPK